MRATLSVRSLRPLRFLLLAGLVAGASLDAQSVPEINFDANADLLSLPSYGEVAGVATNSKGHVFVYARTGHAVATLGDERTFYHGGARLFQFDQNGKFVKEIGQGVYALNFAQQVRVDPQDNVWVVDAGSSQIVKFDAEGRFQLVLGRKPENIGVRPGPGVPASGGMPAEGAAPAGRGGEGGGGRGGGRGAPGAGINGDSFNRPSDVTWDRGGNIYVADGFGPNNRVAKFTRDGNFVKTWGQTGSAQGQFNQIRGIAADASGNIYVADAGNKRIQVFDGEGTFKSQITNVGTPQALCLSGGSTQYLFSSNSNEPESMERGEIYKVRLTGEVVGKFGRAGKLPKEFGMVNSLDCRTESDLWVGEVWNWRAQKVTLRR
ncbi:MAG TPA: peptidyl-alpha-hydroxyglycine alpha-amidating lyase family protein [Vicinamibacterales bacterium]|nr:peptidyl-alpha-hydroxyglycine alpha-amidating lyase family protein [Vicinamibacterales bacterium]